MKTEKEFFFFNLPYSDSEHFNINMQKKERKKERATPATQFYYCLNFTGRFMTKQPGRE